MNGDSHTTLMELTGIAICLLMSAFFSGSETALTSISTARARLLINENPEKWRILESWLASKKRIIATLLIGNNLVNILISILAYRVIFRLIPDWAEAVSVFGVTLLVLVFGEITPKGLALHYAERIAVPVMRVVWLLDKLLFPLAWPLSRLPLIFSPSGTQEDADPVPTENEIIYHIQRGVDKEVFDDTNQGELLQASIEFNQTMVKEIMIPRTEMVALEQETPIEEALELVIESAHSRLPVYADTPDNIMGILYAKDVLTFLRKPDFSRQAPVSSLIRTEPFFVPETQKISMLLTDMRRRRAHMAIVVDEFGGTAGIITLEDIIEELVGDIQDEHDTDEDELRKVGDGRWQVNAHMPIQDFEDETGISIPDSGDYESIGGFVVATFGRIPRKGKTISVAGMEITIVDSDPRHVKRVEIRRPSQRES